MFVQRIAQVNDAIALLGSETQETADWRAVLHHIHQSQNTHGQIQGKCARLLFDASALSQENVSTAMSLAFRAALTRIMRPPGCRDFWSIRG